MKSDFEIPIDIKNDLVYCQRALTNHILVHQKMASCASMMKIPEGRVQKSLRSIEKEIMDIGNEQKLLFNRLRFLLDYHQITKNVKLPERERLTMGVREELANFSRSSTGDVRPMNVQSRLPEDGLYVKYFRSGGSMDDDRECRDQSSGNSVSDDVIIEQISSSDDEKMEILVIPDDIRTEQKVYSGPRQKVAKQPSSNRPGESLLKPMYQRKIEDAESDVQIRVVRPEVGISKAQKPISQPSQEQPAAISLSRMRLSEALFKAKNATQTKAAPKRVETKSPEAVPASVALTVKCNTPLSSSRSSNASPVEIELVKNELNASDMGQEGFLRIFQLCTPAFSEYLMNRRPQRKKRTCTSTERGEFLYGKFELFEKQFANKRQRQFLYSPPATRAKRRIGSNGTNTQATIVAPKRGKGIKSNASSSSSISSNGSNNSSEKVCLICYKRNNLIQCQKCCGQYHAVCHSGVHSTDTVTRQSICPFCVRQKVYGKLPIKGRQKN